MDTDLPSAVDPELTAALDVVGYPPPGSGLAPREAEEQATRAGVVAGLPVAVLTTDVAGQVLAANPTATSFLGVPLPQLQGQALTEHVVADDRARVQQALAALLLGDGHLHRRVGLVTPRESTLEVDLYAVRDHGRVEPTVTWVVSRTDGELDDEALPRALVALTRLAPVVTGVEELLPATAQICQTALGDSVSISVTMGHPSAPDLLASTSTLAQSVDGAQMLADEGPCAHAHDIRSTVVSPDLTKDERWPRLRELVAGLAVQGAVASPIQIEDQVVGALNVFLAAGNTPSARLVRWCEVLVVGIGSLVHAVQERGELRDRADDLRQALLSRAVIDQAKGIVMADRRCTPDEAFRHLVDQSSRQHVKVRDLAAELVERTARGS